MNKHFKVDSCKLSIPLAHCDVIDKSLSDNYEETRTNIDTGEVEVTKKYKGKPYQLSFDDDTSVKIWIQKQITYSSETNEKYNEDYITLLLNSKHLGNRYFEGITKDTIELLYRYMMSLEVFKCSFESFSGARYSDIDICYDFKCNENEFSILKNSIKKSANELLYFHTTDKKDNSGIWTPTRVDPRKQATPSKPYVKFYSKEADFRYHSHKFANKYFKPKDYKGLVRFECTIKNSQHKKRLSLDKPTFLDFLESDLQLIAGQIFREYFTELKKTRIAGMTPTEKVLIDLINLSAEKGATKAEIHKIFDRQDIGKMARQRLLKKYDNLYQSEELNKTKLEANRITEDVMKTLGVDLAK